MASFDPPKIPQPRVSPALLVGATSPLWTYFGAVAAGGMAYWWMTQWARPRNLEAVFDRAGSASFDQPMVGAADAVIEMLGEAEEVAADDAPLTVGGEAAPVSPLLEALPPAEPQPVVVPEAGSEAVLAVTAGPVIDEPEPVATESAADPAPKLRAKKAGSPAPETDA